MKKSLFCLSCKHEVHVTFSSLPVDSEYPRWVCVCQLPALGGSSPKLFFARRGRVGVGIKKATLTTFTINTLINNKACWRCNMMWTHGLSGIMPFFKLPFTIKEKKKEEKKPKLFTELAEPHTRETSRLFFYVGPPGSPKRCRLN